MNTANTKKSPWIIVAVLVFCTMIATFNETILNVALLPIAEEFSVSNGTAQWLVTSYMLVSTVMVPVTAFLYQSIPTKVSAAILRRAFRLCWYAVCFRPSAQA